MRLVTFSPAINGSPEQCLPSSFTGIIDPIAKLNKFSAFPLLQITNPNTSRTTSKGRMQHSEAKLPS